MHKETQNGVILINGLSFLDFSGHFRGSYIIDKKTGYKVAKFMMFWKGLTPEQVKKWYNLERR